MQNRFFRLFGILFNPLYMHFPLINLDRNAKSIPQFLYPLASPPNHVLRVRLGDTKLFDMRRNKFGMFCLGDVVRDILSHTSDISRRASNDNHIILLFRVAGFSADVHVNSCAGDYTIGLVADEGVEGCAVGADNDFMVLSGDVEGLFFDVGSGGGEGLQVFGNGG